MIWYFFTNSETPFRSIYHNGFCSGHFLQGKRTQLVIILHKPFLRFFSHRCFIDLYNSEIPFLGITQDFARITRFLGFSKTRLFAVPYFIPKAVPQRHHTKMIMRGHWKQKSINSFFIYLFFKTCSWFRNASKCLMVQFFTGTSKDDRVGFLLFR